MCGIAGIAGRGDSVAADAVGSMVAALAHRGPDDHGVQPLTGAILGHTRLSIIDLNTGHQPLSTQDGRYWITYNGEIYNYRELHAELAAAGYQFRTRSDTEVLLAAYRVWGQKAFRRFNGMYACVIWDNQTRQLLALRDRMGKKPLYYTALADGSMLFASEVKALLATDLIRGKVTAAAVDAYLALGYVPPNQTMFSNISVLPASSYLTWQGGRIDVGTYWRPDFTTDGAIGEQEAVDELRRRMEGAVERRMVADVPVGAFLSGGLDSTTVVTYMARHSGIPIKTFSVGFGEVIDELPFAGTVARHLGTEHCETQMDIRVGEMLTRMAEIFDEPLADSSSIPTYMVSRFAAEKVKVVLTGDGGDELFAGYDWWNRPLVASERLDRGMLAYAGLRLATRVLTFGASLGMPVAPAIGRLWERRRLIDLARAHPDLWARQRANATRFSEGLRSSLWRKEMSDAVRTPPAVTCPDEVTGLNRAFWFDLTSYLPGDILVKVDRAAMAVGLETRCPLLDQEVVEFALKLPVSLKLRDGHGKHVFKRAFADLWPEPIRNRAKHGFGAPEATWLRRDDVRAIVDRILLGSGSPLGVWLDMDGVRSRARSYYASQQGFSSTQMWSLLTLGLWLEHWSPQLEFN